MVHENAKIKSSNDQDLIKASNDNKIEPLIDNTIESSNDNKIESLIDNTIESSNDNKIESSNESSNDAVKLNEKTDLTTKKSIRTVKIGSRKSKLAIIQAEFVIENLNKFYNKSTEQFKFELITISTKGDKILDVPLSNIGSKALFTKELEIALIKNEIDLIVHSCKDLPTNLPPGLCISALLKREIADDVLVLKKGLECKFNSLDNFLKNHHLIFKDKRLAIGTSSLRRIAQLKRLNNQIKIEDIRGNIDTRLKKLDDENSPYSSLILAGAGLKRAGFEDRITAVLNNDWWYAVGQGALAVECREGDEFTQNLLYPLIDHQTTFEVIAERSFMQYLEGGCSVPLGVRSEFIFNEQIKENLEKKLIDKELNKNKEDNEKDLSKINLSNQSIDNELKNQLEKNQTDKEKQLINNSNKDKLVHNQLNVVDNIVENIVDNEMNIDEQLIDKNLEKQNTLISLDNKLIEKNNQLIKDNEQLNKLDDKLDDKLIDKLVDKLDDKLDDKLVDKLDNKLKDNLNKKLLDISFLKLSGIVVSLNGEKNVQLTLQLKDLDQNLIKNEKIDCTKIVLPTSKCPYMAKVREQFYSCAKLGIQLAKGLQSLGAKEILDEINKNRKPLTE